MNRRPWFASALLALLLAGTVHAQTVELRTVTLADGTVYRGAVVATDDENLTLKTLKGEVKLSLMEIIQVDPLDRATWLTQEGRRWIYLGVNTPTGASASVLARATAIDQTLLEVLQRDELLVVNASELSPELGIRLKGCADLDCRIEALRGQNSPVIYGLLQGRDRQERLILRRLNSSLDQDNELIISLGDIQAERSRLVRSAALLLGEKPPPEVPVTSKASDPATGLNSKPRPETAAKPEATGKTEGPTRTETVPTGTSEPAVTSKSKPEPPQQSPGTSTAQKTTMSRPTQSTPAEAKPFDKEPTEKKPTENKPTENKPTEARVTPTAPAEPSQAKLQRAWPGLDLSQARRLDLLPVPGASSLLYFKDPKGVAVAAGSVALFTTASVYLAGDMTLLGMPDGLPVGWTYPDRGLRDGLLLTGVGAASFVATTWLVNQAVRAVQVQHYKRTHPPVLVPAAATNDH